MDPSPTPHVSVPAPGTVDHRAGNRALVAIGVYKGIKAVLFTAAAFGVFKMLHKDTAVELTKLLHVFRIGGDRSFVKDLLLKSNVIDDPKKRIIGALLAIYGVLFGIEGVGLMWRKRWGEYFSAIITASLVPYEVYEVFHRTARAANSQLVNLVPADQRSSFLFSRVLLFKIVVLLGNIAIVWFLVNHIRRNPTHPAHPLEPMDPPGPAVPAPTAAQEEMSAGAPR